MNENRKERKAGLSFKQAQIKQKCPVNRSGGTPGFTNRG